MENKIADNLAFKEYNIFDKLHQESNTSKNQKIVKSLIITVEQHDKLYANYGRSLWDFSDTIVLPKRLNIIFGKCITDISNSVQVIIRDRITPLVIKNKYTILWIRFNVYYHCSLKGYLSYPYQLYKFNDITYEMLEIYNKQKSINHLIITVD